MGRIPVAAVLVAGVQVIGVNRVSATGAMLPGVRCKARRLQTKLLTEPRLILDLPEPELLPGQVQWARERAACRRVREHVPVMSSCEGHGGRQKSRFDCRSLQGRGSKESKQNKIEMAEHGRGNDLPGTPIFVDGPSRVSSQAPATLPDVPEGETRDVRMRDVSISDWEYVYMLTSEPRAVHLHEAVAVRQSDHDETADHPAAAASRRGHDAQRVGRTGGDTTVMIEVKRKLWLAEDSDIERERGEQVDEVASCPICLEPMYSGKSLVTSCSHCFHVDCCRQSERVAVGATGFWSCPSCRETITTIYARTVQDGEASADWNTAPTGDNGINLTYVLRRNPAMQSIIRNLLLLNDYVIGTRDKESASDAPAQGLPLALPTSASVSSQTSAVVEDESSIAHANSSAQDGMQRERSATAGRPHAQLAPFLIMC